MEATLQKIFSTSSLDAVSKETLDDLTSAYPYFAPLQYFQTLKLKFGDHQEYEISEGKAAIYFNNPLWFREKLKGLPLRKPLVAEREPEEILIDENPEEELEITERTPPLNIRYSGEPLSETAGAIKDPAAHQAEVQKEELPIFQAYHTVDYFASQGIKISADMLQKDKLGRQLKSFTEWLRTMKKIPAASGQQENVADPRILRFAETSLREREVVTEAMAEVLLKQGKRQAAIEIYEKLKLLGPHKSAYFATLIEKLKAV